MDRAVAGEESLIWFKVSPQLSDGMLDGCGLFCKLHDKTIIKTELMYKIHNFMIDKVPLGV